MYVSTSVRFHVFNGACFAPQLRQVPRMRHVKPKGWASVSPCAPASQTQTVSSLALHSHRCNQKDSLQFALLSHRILLPIDQACMAYYCISFTGQSCKLSEARSALRCGSTCRFWGLAFRQCTTPRTILSFKTSRQHRWAEV